MQYLILRLCHWKHASCFLVMLLLLTACTTAPPSAPTTEAPTPSAEVAATERGMGGTLRLVYFQAPTLLNPHLAGNIKDLEASRITYEPLASFDSAGQLVPFLAAEIPSVENGDVAADGRSVTWRLHADVRWSDGEPFTADDVVFTYEYITNPDVPAAFAGLYTSVSRVEALDDHTVQITFAQPTASWWLPFVGSPGMILPRHIFEQYNGLNADDAPANLLPVGTGPYIVDSFQPQEVIFLATDLVRTYRIVYVPNPYFRDPDKPYFARIELRGGGTSGVAIRAVMEEGSADYAWNPQVSPEEVRELEANGIGSILTSFESRIHFLQLNFTDPQRGSSPAFPNPIFEDKRVRQAFAYAINRERIAEEVYGVLGQPEDDYLLTPDYYKSPEILYTYDKARARALLEAAGWVDTNGDGIREKDGTTLRVVYHVPVNPQYQEIQQIVADELRSIGFDVERVLRDPNDFFGDPALTNSWIRFNADIAGAGWLSNSPDPVPHMAYWTCSDIPTAENGWTGFNISRWCNESYDELLTEASTELDEERREQMFMQLNDMLIEDVAFVTLVQIARVAAVSNTLQGLT
ncbi:MAG: peptide ABC transporter substrate-binding protein [Chloroflexaceae bacterium]|nr:peptide ABC transporter substrate-binding protein [Chloroflexaceae bacterium]